MQVWLIFLHKTHLVQLRQCVTDSVGVSADGGWVLGVREGGWEAVLGGRLRDQQLGGRGGWGGWGGVGSLHTCTHAYTHTKVSSSFLHAAHTVTPNS